MPATHQPEHVPAAAQLEQTRHTQPHSSGTARIAIAYHSGYGHTARQAEAVAAGADAVPGATADLVPLDELTDDVWARLAAADAIIFGAPTYMAARAPSSRRSARRAPTSGPTTSAGATRSPRGSPTPRRCPATSSTASWTSPYWLLSTA